MAGLFCKTLQLQETVVLGQVSALARVAKLEHLFYPLAVGECNSQRPYREGGYFLGA